MSAIVPVLEISGLKNPLPTCSPNLMPFHIGYSGPAPISTFFRVKEAPLPEFLGNSSASASQTVTRPPSPSRGTSLVSESQQTLVAGSSSSSSTTSLAADASTVTLTSDVDMDAQDTSDVAESQHLVAAFRGRTVRGLTVALPEGYAGLVLDAPEYVKGKAAVSSVQAAEDTGKGGANKAPTSKRSTRRATGSVEEPSGDEEDLDAELASMLEESGPVRSLKPTSTFFSFVLWNADRPVDESRDEYLRTITEWTKLSAAVHHYED